MPDPDELERPRLPMKFTVASVLIYLAPIACFGWFGPGWKVASVIPIAIGVWRSPGFLRRAFGIALLLSLVIWGEHARVEEQDWPGPPLLMIWWFWSFGTRVHADGVRAQAQGAARGWE
ncbi:MAG TPA: hypothetical protein VN841_07005 [Bryobacteraceae bacterium]|nr:hypothetical protein [Bryobacteraceae bacterium]